MLSWSGQQSDTEIDLAAVARGRGDVGVPYADELLRFASAAACLDDDLAEMDDSRRALVSIAGQSVMIDAAAVAANFHMMTRLADGTGARFTQARLESSAPAIEIMGAAEMLSRR
jgi:hypothetical protein